MAQAENEDGENFNQTEWLTTFNENYPEIEIPEEPVKDIDIDFDVNEDTAYEEDKLDGQDDVDQQNDRPARKHSVESGQDAPNQML